MRKQWLLVLAGLVVLYTSTPARANQNTLDSLITAALRNYPELQASQMTAEAAEAATRAAGKLPETNFSLAAMNLPTGSFAFDRTPMTGVWIGAAQRIPWPGKLRAKSDVARLEHERAVASLADLRNRLIRQVSEAYWEYSYWSLADRELADYVGLLSATGRIAEERYANGQSSAQDVLRVNTMITRMTVRREKAEQMIRSARVRLIRLVGDSTRLLQLEPSLPEPASEPVNTGSIAQNPALQSAEFRYQASESKYRLASAEKMPDFVVGLDYGIRQDIMGDPVQGEDFMTFKLGFSLPLFSGQGHRVRSAQQRTLAAREETRAVHDQLVEQLDRARLSLDFTVSSLNRYDGEILPQAEAALEAAEVAYEVGKIDFNALLDAQSDLIDIQLERLDLLRQHNQTLALIDQLTATKTGRQ